MVSSFELFPLPLAEDVEVCDWPWRWLWRELPLLEMVLLPEFLTVDVEEELPEFFTLPPVADPPSAMFVLLLLPEPFTEAEPPAPPAPPTAVAMLLFRLVLDPPVAVDVEDDPDTLVLLFVLVFLFLFVLVLVLVLVLEVEGSEGGAWH